MSYLEYLYAEMSRLSGWNKADSLLAVDARLIDALPEMRAQRLVKAVSAQVPSLIQRKQV